MSLKHLLFSQKSSAIAVLHNPKYASDIFLMSFTAVLLDCLKQTYQIFRAAVFSRCLWSLILPYDLISLFPSIFTGNLQKLHNLNTKCCVTSVLLRFSAKKSQNYRFQWFLVRIYSENLPTSILVKFVVYSDIQEHLLYWLL